MKFFHSDHFPHWGNCNLDLSFTVTSNVIKYNAVFAQWLATQTTDNAVFTVASTVMFNTSVHNMHGSGVNSTPCLHHVSGDWQNYIVQGCVPVTRRFADIMSTRLYSEVIVQLVNCLNIVQGFLVSLVHLDWQVLVWGWRHTDTRARGDRLRACGERVGRVETFPVDRVIRAEANKQCSASRHNVR